MQSCDWLLPLLACVSLAVSGEDKIVVFTGQQYERRFFEPTQSGSKSKMAVSLDGVTLTSTAGATGKT